MMQNVADSLYDAIRAFGTWLQSMCLYFVIAGGLTATAAALLFWRQPERFERLVMWLKPRAALFASWLIALAMTCLLSFILVRERQMVIRQMDAEEGAALTSTKEAPSNSVDQVGPVAAYLRERTFKRELRLPSELASRISAEGAQALAPYMMQGFSNAVRVNESFVRQGPDIVFTREAFLREEVPIVIDKAEVRAKFDTQRDAKGKPYFGLAFEGTYAFHNPLDQEVQSRFVFVPPDGATLGNLTLKVGDVEVAEPGPEDYYVWEGALAANATLIAVARYETSGGQSFSYNIGSGRRRTGEFRLTVESDADPKFMRGSLFPSTSESGRSIWQLNNVITSETIDLAFPQDLSERESLDNALAFCPVGLGFFFAWLTLRTILGRPTSPHQAVFSTLALGFGFASIGVFLGYFGTLWAIVAGAALACVLTFVSCGPRLLPGVALAALSPLTLLIPEHSSVVLLALAVVSLISLVPRGKARVDVPTGET